MHYTQDPRAVFVQDTWSCTSWRSPRSLALTVSWLMKHRTVRLVRQFNPGQKHSSMSLWDALQNVIPRGTSFVFEMENHSFSQTAPSRPPPMQCCVETLAKQLTLHEGEYLINIWGILHKSVPQLLAIGLYCSCHPSWLNVLAQSQRVHVIFIISKSTDNGKLCAIFF